LLGHAVLSSPELPSGVDVVEVGYDRKVGEARPFRPASALEGKPRRIAPPGDPANEATGVVPKLRTF
jgi:hypothetical protein